MDYQAEYLKKVDEVAEARHNLAIHSMIEYRIKEERFNKVKAYLQHPNLILRDEAVKAREAMRAAAVQMKRRLRYCDYSEKQIEEITRTGTFDEKQFSNSDWNDDDYWDVKDKTGRWERERDAARTKFESATKEMEKLGKQYKDQLIKEGKEEDAAWSKISTDRNDRDGRWNRDKRKQSFLNYYPKFAKGAWECGAICKTIPDHACTRHTYDPACWQHSA